MSSEIQVTGKKYRILTDVTNKVWTVISFVSKAVDTIFNDGKTAEAKLGAIDGITSDLSGESETIAASIKCVNELNSSLVNENGEIFRYGYQDGKRGVWVKEADTDVFVPFKSGGITIKEWYGKLNGGYNQIIFDTTDLTTLNIGVYKPARGLDSQVIQYSNEDGNWVDLLKLTKDSGVSNLDISPYNTVRIYFAHSAAVGSIIFTDIVLQ